MNKYSGKWTIGNQANCMECSESHYSAPSDYDASTNWGRRHSKETGHVVHVERVTITEYGG